MPTEKQKKELEKAMAKAHREIFGTEPSLFFIWTRGDTIKLPKELGEILSKNKNYLK